MIAEPKQDETTSFSGSMETENKSKTFVPAASSVNTSTFNNIELSRSTPTLRRSFVSTMSTTTPCITTMNSKIASPIGGLVPRMKDSTMRPLSAPPMPFPRESSNTLTDGDNEDPSSSSVISSSSDDASDETSTTSDTSYQRRRRAKLRRYQKRREETVLAAAAAAAATQRRTSMSMGNNTNTTYQSVPSSPRLNKIEIGCWLHIRFPPKPTELKNSSFRDDDFFDGDEQSLSSLSGYDSEDVNELANRGIPQSGFRFDDGKDGNCTVGAATTLLKPLGLTS